MHAVQLLWFTILIAAWLPPLAGFGEERQPVALATHNQSQQSPSAADTKAIERIRKIILNQGDDARALANLVQLARELPAPVSSQLYSELANDYLRRGKYNQAASILQQLHNQYPEQPLAKAAMVKLVRLYSSSEVAQSEIFNQSETQSQSGRQGFLKYASFVAESALQKNATLADDAPLTFQRAVTTRLGGRPKAAQSRLTRLRHARQAGPWQTCAQAEHWLQSDRKKKPPKPILVCRWTDTSPHLDGTLTDPLWQRNEPVQFAYDDEFLYLTISYPKVDGLDYTPDTRPRSHDADLTGHDLVRLRLDADRDYATCFELAVDHRGWTTDRCWLDPSWNLQWFIAAGGDDSHWTIEAAIPWGQITYEIPRAGDAWAIAWERVLPDSVGRYPVAEVPSPVGGVEAFHLLLF